MSHNGTQSPATVQLAGRVAVYSADAGSLSQLAAVLTRQGHDVVPFSDDDQMRAALSAEAFSSLPDRRAAVSGTRGRDSGVRA